MDSEEMKLELNNLSLEQAKLRHDWNKEKFSSCPYCGGTTGFEVFNIIRHRESMGWNGEVFSVDGDTIREGKDLKCIDCKKTVGKSLDLKK